MKLTIFGGTGKTGRLLVEQALAAGHEVTVLARRPEKLDLKHERLRVIPGNALDPVPVAEAVAGADAIISVLAPGKDQPPMSVSRATTNILRAATDHGVRRIVVSAGAGVGDPQDRPGLFDRIIVAALKRTAPEVYEDMRAAADVVRASDQEWTLVRAPMLTNQPGTGTTRAGYLGKGVGSRLSRADLAAFLLEVVTEHAYLRAAPVVSN